MTQETMMMSSETGRFRDWEIAAVVHEMTRGLQYVNGDEIAPQWVLFPAERQQVVIDLIAEIRRGKSEPEIHEFFNRRMTALGYVQGTLKNGTDNHGHPTHPLVGTDWWALPGCQRLKDTLAILVTLAMAGAER